MDTERLADLRRVMRGKGRGPSVLSSGEAAELLAAHDYYRARCPVTAEDVEKAGVIPVHALAWARAAGWTESDDEPWPPPGERFGLVRLSRPGEKSECTSVLFDDGGADNLRCVASVCNRAGGVPLDILDEMAATATEAAQSEIVAMVSISTDGFLSGPVEVAPPITRPGGRCLRATCPRNDGGSCSAAVREVCPS